MKICSICEAEKSVDDFPSIGMRCKRCLADRSNKFRKNFPDKANETRKKSQARYLVKRRELIDSIKNIPCKDCGNTYPPYVMDFDHVKGQKIGNIAEIYQCSIKNLLSEIEKCDIVCSNCHRIRTHNRLK